MYHSVTFGSKNTWTDWHLIPDTRPLFLPPEVNTRFVDIPGGNGSLDFTESLVGHPTYKDRSGSMNFTVDNDHESWEIIYSNILNYLHGRKMQAILEDDPNYYYEGRFSVNKWTSSKNNSTIVIDYEVYPYKKDIRTKNNDNFTLSGGSKSVTLTGLDEPVVPTFQVSNSSSLSVVFNGNTYTLNDGLNIVPKIETSKGDNVLKFSGTGTVTIDYIGGTL
jgi:phage-related protein